MSLFVPTFEQKVLKWSYDRKLFKNTTSKDQCLKLQEELGELSRAILHNDIESIKDSLGDMSVVMVQIAAKYDMKLSECQDHAYNQIKDRTGQLFNGTFIKDE